MNHLNSMIWIELRKATRSRLPLWTAIGSLFMPLGVAFLLFVSKNPQISQKLGLISAKADLMSYAATDWAAYLSLSAQMVAAGGFFLLVMAMSWIFGREFADGTLKDLLAKPVARPAILLAKFCVAAAWSAGLTGVIFAAALAMGALLRLPGGSPVVILQGSRLVLVSACLVFAVVTPFGFFASVGRGYLLPLGLAVLALMSANLAVVLGWGEFFPWAVPMLYSQGGDALPPGSYWVVLLTALAGIAATLAWYQAADQNR